MRAKNILLSINFVAFSLFTLPSWGSYSQCDVFAGNTARGLPKAGTLYCCENKRPTPNVSIIKLIISSNACNNKQWFQSNKCPFDEFKLYSSMHLDSTMRVEKEACR